MSDSGVISGVVLHRKSALIGPENETEFGHEFGREKSRTFSRTFHELENPGNPEKHPFSRNPGKSAK